MVHVSDQMAINNWIHNIGRGRVLADIDIWGVSMKSELVEMFEIILIAVISLAGGYCIGYIRGCIDKRRKERRGGNAK